MAGQPLAFWRREEPSERRRLSSQLRAARREVDFREPVRNSHAALIDHIRPDGSGDRFRRRVLFHTKMLADFFEFFAIRAVGGVDDELTFALIPKICTEDF